jgi:hypothetical protein
MVHYTCDGCKRTLDAQNDLRYVMKIEVYAAVDPLDLDDQEDRDNLDDLHDMLEGVDDARADELDDAVYQQHRFDLCPECRKRFMKNPLGRKSTEMFDFSEN